MARWLTMVSQFFFFGLQSLHLSKYNIQIQRSESKIQIRQRGESWLGWCATCHRATSSWGDNSRPLHAPLAQGHKFFSHSIFSDRIKKYDCGSSLWRRDPEKPDLSPPCPVVMFSFTFHPTLCTTPCSTHPHLHYCLLTPHLIGSLSVMLS